MRPLSISIVTGPWYPTPPGNAGAVERIWGDLSRRFAARGHRVTVISRAGDGLPRESTEGGVHTIRRTSMSQGHNIKLDLMKDMWYSARMLPLLPKADVCVTNAFWLPALARLRGSQIGKLYVSIARVPKGQLFLYKHAARLHAVSGFIHEAIVRERPELAARTRTIPNPIDLGFFTPPTTPRDLGNVNGKGRVLLFTGRIHPEKGLHELVPAYVAARSRFPDLTLRLVGPAATEKGGGGDDYVAKLRSLAMGHPLTIDPPIYDRARLADALRAASFYCYPSLAEAGESFGVAPLEAGATGLAPICSDLPAFKEFLVGGQNGIVFDHRGPSCAKNMQAAIEMLAGDPALAQRLGDTAVETARRYDYERVSDEFLEDFASLVEPAPKGSS